VRRRKNDRSRSEKVHSRSISKLRKGAASKEKSDSHRADNASLKRRQGDAEKKVKQKEVPRKREADSTDSPSRSKVRKESQSLSSAPHRPKHRLSDRKEKEKHSDKSSRQRKASAEEGEIEESPSIERPFDQTEKTLDDRFTSLSSKTKSFKPDENVTIEIERSVAGRAVPFAIPPFWSDAVQIVRRSDESKKPLNDREEFLHVEDSDDERRVIKVKKSTLPENFNVRRDRVQPAERRALSAKDSRSRRSELSHRIDDSRRGRYERVESGRGDYKDNIGLVVTRNRGDSDGRSR